MTVYKWLLAGVLSLLLLAVASGVWLLEEWQKPLLLTQPQLLEVTKGTSSASLLNQFKQQGWIESTLPGRLLLKSQPQLSHIRAGLYQLEPEMDLQSLFTLLSSGKEKQLQIALVEGLTWQQWQHTLSQAPMLLDEQLNIAKLQQLTGRTEISNFEGLFLPDTYNYTANTRASEVILRAYREMQEQLQRAWQNRQPGLPLNTPYEALILASIVEKETGLAAERAHIAGVFVNRLHLGMRLQTDPTVIYGMGDAFDGNITRKDLRTKTPYNTYRIDGLPPTPIAMPSLAAIKAVMHPLATEDLYFVARGDGSHQFSATLDAHNAAVRKYQLKGQK